MMDTNALCIEVANPNTILELIHKDSLITWASARDADLIAASCRSTSHAV